MKMMWCAVFLTGFACTSEEYEVNTVVGRWEMEWNLEEMTTTGQIEFTEEGTASIVTDFIRNELLPSGSHTADFRWSFTPESLELTRIDNQLTLSYQIITKDKSTIKLNYADEIQITLLRIR